MTLSSPQNGVTHVADHLSCQGQKLTVHDILTSMIQSHEIQGCLALLNPSNRVGLDHVILVKVASTAVVSKLLGLNRDQPSTFRRIFILVSKHARRTLDQVMSLKRSCPSLPIQKLRPAIPSFP